MRPYPFPIGVFAEQFTGAGGAGITRESMFTRNSVEGRASDTSGGGGLRFSGDIDLANDMPPSVHSTSDISTGQCGQSNKFAHQPGSPCNTTVPDYYDR